MKKLGFGFMRLPLLDGADQTSFDKEQICRMVDSFMEQGFTYFDTAWMYHDGKSEGMLREALVERYDRDSFMVATKLPTMSLNEVEDMERIFAEQLERTGAGYFDYYLLHCLTKDNYATCKRLDAFSFVQQKKADGLARRIGFSFHDSAELLDTILTEHPEMEFVQLQINYLDWDDNNVQSRACYEVARKHGKDIIVMEPVKGGTLANVPERVKRMFLQAQPRMSVPSWAIRYAAGLEGVICVLSGMSNFEQLADNTGYMAELKPLDAEETALVFKAAEIIRSGGAIACTACRYCVEGCPMNIPIPDYFALHNEVIKGEADKAAYGELSQGHGKAGECIGCGQCEGHCPQHLEIIKLLQDIAEEFE